MAGTKVVAKAKGPKIAAGGKFDPVLYIDRSDDYRVKWPQGPLTLSGTEEVTWIEAWVVQQSSGASQSSHETSATGSMWLADNFRWKEGRFEPGPATGIALVSTVDARRVARYFWWSVDPIELKYKPRLRQNKKAAS